MRACVSGGAMANSHSGRADAKATPWGDNSSMGRPALASCASTDANPTLIITAPMMALLGVSLS